MNKFKVGDRIKIYSDTLNGVMGTITYVLQDIWLSVNLDIPWDTNVVFHYKQCRKLKKKQIVIVYAHFNGSCFLGANLNGQFNLQAGDRIVEFIERKKK